MGINRVLHPPYNSALRAFCHQTDGFSYSILSMSTVLEPQPYLDRNGDVVGASAIFLAAPKGKAEELESGTWSTIRKAKLAKLWVILVYPDGTWEDFGPRPAWCGIRDDRYIAPDEQGHRWDGDHCIQCGFDYVDAQGFGKGPIPTCAEWGKPAACLCRTGGAMICESCSDGEKCQCRACF